MPKDVREVKSFNLGVVTAADDNDIKIDAAVYSKDIDPNASEGKLRGRWKDSLIDLPVYRGKPIYTTPDTTDEVTREINIDNSSSVGMELYFEEEKYEVKVNLIGSPPTSQVTVKLKMKAFSRDSGYIKISHDGTNYNNSGEFDTLVFSTSNYATSQSLYLVCQSASIIDRTVPIMVSAQSTDSLWNSSNLNYTMNYLYKATVESQPGIIIKRSTYKNHGVTEGLQGEYRIDLKLSYPPGLDLDTSSVDIIFTSNDPDRLYVHWTGGNATKLNTKTFSFTNLNWSTYQTLYPFVLDDGIKQGNLQFSMEVTGVDNGSLLYDFLNGGIEGNIRFDDGTFLDNDFHSPVNPWNIGALEASIAGGGDGTGNEDGEKGWKDGP